MSVDILGQYSQVEYKDNNKKLGIVKHGSGNVRSLINSQLVKRSPTASFCVGMYSKFISGAGFKYIKDYNLSSEAHKTFTVNNLLDKVADSISVHEGAFVHVQYNALYQKAGYTLIPFEQCKFGLEDDNEYSGKILRSRKGWSKRNNKNKDVIIYDVYNPSERFIKSQVQAAGGWDNYKGQILFITTDDTLKYPESKIEGVENYAHVENKMGSYFASTVERGFDNVQVFEYVEAEDEKSNKAIKESVQGAMGLDSGGKIIALKHKNTTNLKDEERYRFTPIENNATPEKYESMLAKSSQMIRSKYGIPTQLFEAISGKLGNTGAEDLKTAQSMYNATTQPVREVLQTAFKELFRDFKEDVNPANEWTIGQYSIISEDGTIEEANV